VRPTAMHDDLAVLLPFAERDVGITMSTFRGSASEDGFFMLRLSPGDVQDGLRVARDITVVVDVSGSMSGEKMTQAKSALRQLLGTLGRDDRFRLIKFSGGSDLWRSEWTRAEPAELRAADRWVENLRAEGGTNIGDALADAFAATSPSARLSVVVFLTDGLPSVGEQNPERIAAIAERAAGSTRVFAFGVGHDVNTYLLDRLGAAGRGGAQYVQPGESVETALSTLSTKIQYPVLTDIALRATGVTLREIYPTTLPDLFAGEDLVVFGRYRAPVARGLNGMVTINGLRSGRAERYSTRVSYATSDNGNDYIPRLWASRKLGELTRRVKLEGSDRELIAEIRATALRYGLLSEYTSYFVAEPGATPVLATGNTPPPSLQQRGSIGRVEGLAKADRNLASGADAVASAESARKRREATTVGQVAALDRAEEQKMAASAGKGADVSAGATGNKAGAVTAPRVVAGRTFVLRNGVWESAGANVAQKKLDVMAFSDAYFALLQALPELKPYTALGNVSVAGSDVTIRLLDKGVAKLTDAELTRIIVQFRGAARGP
jgi:Ca-activated chloride channel homolog